MRSSEYNSHPGIGDAVPETFERLRVTLGEISPFRLESGNTRSSMMIAFCSGLCLVCFAHSTTLSTGGGDKRQGILKTGQVIRTPRRLCASSLVSPFETVP